MSENKSDADTPMFTVDQAATFVAARKPNADVDGSPKRKIAKTGGNTTHLSQFQTTTSKPPASQPVANPPPVKTSYAGATASAAPKVNPANPDPTSSIPVEDNPSICLQAMIAGAKMLRK